jgi:putative tryptophan/tyrosine transport system substrate-binding protein
MLVQQHLPGWRSSIAFLLLGILCRLRHCDGFIACFLLGINPASDLRQPLFSFLSGSLGFFVTGTTNFFYETGSKWLELLKQVAPRVERVAIIYSSQISSIDQYAPPIEQAARLLTVKAMRMPYIDALDIVRAIDAFATEPNGGLIVVPTTPTAANRALINRLAMQHRLPTIYPYSEGVVEGGLIGYGSNNADRFRSASSFVDRILRGAKVSELPVQFPPKFELVINLKIAKALGLMVPESILLSADEVIE